MDVQEGVVLFADIVGSTRIFEQLGDQLAAERIGNCITELAKITHTHNGVIIKTIGDEIMCSFAKADHAMLAAGEMQRNSNLMPGATEENIALRIGAHFGKYIATANDIAGDAVNIAARLATAAGARRILISHDTIEQLSRVEKSKTRPYDRITLKGKQDETFIYEYLWEMTDVTTISVPISFDELPIHRLRLNHKDQHLTLTSESDTFCIGRHEKNQLIVNSNMSSRLHAKIEYQRGKFLLIDESTNGTFVKMNNEEIYIRRESVPLVGNGLISLGESTNNDHGQLITFSIQ